MEKTIHIKVRKDLNARQQQDVIQLKGSLISRGYTHIIHVEDQDDEFHVNSFETSPEKRSEVQEDIAAFVGKENLGDTIFLKC